MIGLGLSEKEEQSITYFLNFRLNYIRIILGIVIATKIY